eukprot:COSAG06_NODE_5258_length_3604_cov_147.017689_4_plen_368_part_01
MVRQSASTVADHSSSTADVRRLQRHFADVAYKLARRKRAAVRIQRAYRSSLAGPDVSARYQHGATLPELAVRLRTTLGVASASPRCLLAKAYGHLGITYMSRPPATVDGLRGEIEWVLSQIQELARDKFEELAHSVLTGCGLGGKARVTHQGELSSTAGHAVRRLGVFKALTISPEVGPRPCDSVCKDMRQQSLGDFLTAHGAEAWYCVYQRMLVVREQKKRVASVKAEVRTRVAVLLEMEVELTEQVEVDNASVVLCTDDPKAYAHGRWAKKRASRHRSYIHAYSRGTRTGASRKTCGAASWKDHRTQVELVVKVGAREGRTESCRAKRRRRAALRQQRDEDAQKKAEQETKLLQASQKDRCAERAG